MEICQRVGHHRFHFVFASRSHRSGPDSQQKTSAVEAAVTISTSNGMDVASGIGNSSNWLDGKKILLTGATGYLGKVICEKLLRECFGIRRLYILVRASENEDLQQRTHRFKQDVVFDRVKAIERGVMDKVIPVEGDLGKVNLELQHYDRDVLCSEVNVIIHAGCNSDLYVGLKDAVLTNVRGTRYILQLAERMASLESFVYVSHVFSNCYERIIGERIYPAKFDPNDVIRTQEERKALGMESQIQKDFGNFYLFSHHLAETLVSQSSVPSAVARLSTLTPSLDEPYPGWIDTSNHLDNLMMYTGNGSVQSLHGRRTTPVDILPVDLAARGIITIAQKRATQPTTGCLVYNMTDAGTGEISWRSLLDAHRKMTIENPLETVYWYPGGHIYPNYYMFVATFILFQLIPAVLYDVGSFITTGKIQFVRIQLELFQQLNSVKRFFHNVWMFDTENADELFTNMSFTEKLKFRFRTQNFNLEEYVRNWNYGRRAYLLQLEQKASRVARWKIQGCHILGVILKTLLVLCVGQVLLTVFSRKKQFAESLSIDEVRSPLFSTFQKM